MRQQARSPLLWVITMGCLVLGAGCTRSPDSVVEAFYRALEKGDTAEAKTYISSSLLGSFGEEKTSASLFSESEHIESCGGIDEIHVKWRAESDRRRLGKVTIRYQGDCLSKVEAVVLVEEDGDWKLTASK